MDSDNSPAGAAGAAASEEQSSPMNTSVSSTQPQPPVNNTSPQSSVSMDIAFSTESDEPRTPPLSSAVLFMPPPPPPITSISPARPPVPRPPETPTLRVVSGTLTTAQRSSHRGSRWLLVVLDFESTLPFRLSAPSAILDAVNIWRPRKASTFAESYTSFFPATSGLHVALLDPRSGERLHVWGEPSHEDGDAIEFDWEEVVSYLETFLAQHSIEGHDLGPLHHRDKPWAVSTRRESPAIDTLPPTSAMDDEEAAIAAAIAASLAESRKTTEEDDYEMDDDDEFDDIEDDEDEHQIEDDSGVEGGAESSPAESDIAGNDIPLIDISSNSAESDTTNSSRSIPAAVPIPNSWSDIVSAGTPVSYPGVQVGGGSDSDGDSNPATPSIAIPGLRPSLRDTSRRMSMSPGILARNRMPARSPALSRTPTFAPSSVESLSSSYLDRAHSRLRSAHDPSLLESRALRLQQDAELAASLEADRRKEREKREAEERVRRAQQEREDARNRLPPEPTQGISVALRMPDGSRVTRKFDPKNKLTSVADLCLAHSGVNIVDKPPSQVLWNRASLKKDAAWNADIGDVCTDTRVMFIVHQ